MSARTRKPTAQRREEIAWAALALIGREGLRALTTAALARSVGLTSGALFRHFASLEEVLEEAVRVAEDRVAATLPPADLPPLERLRALARARVALLRAEPGIAWLLRSEQAVPTLPPRAVARLETLVGRSRAYVRTALRDAVRASVARDDVPVDILALTFTSAVHALIGSPGLQGRGPRSPSPSRAIEGVLRLLAAVPGAPRTRAHPSMDAQEKP